jgi:hypothetical protein
MYINSLYVQTCLPRSLWHRYCIVTDDATILQCQAYDIVTA